MAVIGQQNPSVWFCSECQHDRHMRPMRVLSTSGGGV